MSADAAAELGPWQDDAACRGADPKLFFPASPDEVPFEARLLCSDCDVRIECLEHALRHEDFGVWGGTSEAQRDQVRRSGGIRRQRSEAPILAPPPWKRESAGWRLRWPRTRD